VLVQLDASSHKCVLSGGNWAKTRMKRLMEHCDRVCVWGGGGDVGLRKNVVVEPLSATAAAAAGYGNSTWQRRVQCGV